MDGFDAKGKKRGLLNKTWERCVSIGRRPSRDHGVDKGDIGGGSEMRKSKSWPQIPAREGRNRVAPDGCFSVYVGPQRQRFVVKTEYANHPLFKMLLEEAELEYGYCSQGPLQLPCTVDLFHQVLMEMDGDDDEIRGRGGPRGCGFAKAAAGSYRLLSPSRSPMLLMNQF